MKRTSCEKVLFTSEMTLTASRELIKVTYLAVIQFFLFKAAAAWLHRGTTLIQYVCLASRRRPVTNN